MYSQLAAMSDSSGLTCEFIFVDDGSSDTSVALLREASIEDSRVTIVVLRKNFGQTAAMSAGFDYASGDIVAVLDGDLQNDPAEIPRMVAKLEEGYDVVAGWRKDRKDKMLSRRLPSMLANKLISKMTGVNLHDYGCTLKVFRSEVVKNIQLYGEMHRFIPAIAAQMGVKIAELPVNHRARVHGTSKYGISRTFRVVLDLLTVVFFLLFSTRPLHMFGGLGLVSGMLGTAFLTLIGIQKFFFDIPMGSRPMLVLGTMLVVVGLQFICFGILAEVMVRTYHESQDKKTYAVRDILRSLPQVQEGKVVGVI
ncbi:UNVERIFIED_CONTAM: hypothetical protein GTU68_048624 [Idotea baltica]|nr:hypothetical protein [Idotea baltica]